MARIRAIKPEFFKHGELQDLENAHKGKYIMLVYAGLWTQCDKQGVFYYEARALKNEVLPYIDFNMQETLNILENSGFFVVFTTNDRRYGYIPTFSKYQFPTKGERQSAAKYPPPPDNIRNLPKNVLKNVPKSEGKRNKDKGKRNKDINSSLISSDKETTSKHEPKLPLREREPVNDMERVEKAYLQNWDTLYSQNKVKTPNPVINWNQTRSLLKTHFINLTPEIIIQAINNGMKDDFIMSGGYSLGTMLAAGVLNRLINSGGGPPPGVNGKKTLSGLDSIFKHHIASDNISPEEMKKYIKEE